MKYPERFSLTLRDRDGFMKRLHLKSEYQNLKSCRYDRLFGVLVWEHQRPPRFTYA